MPKPCRYVGKAEADVANLECTISVYRIAELLLLLLGSGHIVLI